MSNTEENGLPRCFICLEDCDPNIICMCISMHCHTHCQQRLIDTIGKAECAVCKSMYKNVTVEKHLNCRCKDVVFFSTTCFVLSVTACMIWLYTLNPTRYYLLAEAVLMLSGTASIVFIWRRNLSFSVRQTVSDRR